MGNDICPLAIQDHDKHWHKYTMTGEIMGRKNHPALNLCHFWFATLCNVHAAPTRKSGVCKHLRGLEKKDRDACTAGPARMCGA